MALKTKFSQVFTTEFTASLHIKNINIMVFKVGQVLGKLTVSVADNEFPNCDVKT